MSDDGGVPERSRSTGVPLDEGSTNVHRENDQSLSQNETSTASQPHIATPMPPLPLLPLNTTMMQMPFFNPGLYVPPINQPQMTMYVPSAVPVMQTTPVAHRQSVAVHPQTQGQCDDLDKMSSVGPLKSVETNPSNVSKPSQEEEAAASAVSLLQPSDSIALDNPGVVDGPLNNDSPSSQNQLLYLGQKFEDDEAFDSTMNTYMVNTNGRLNSEMSKNN